MPSKVNGSQRYVERLRLLEFHMSAGVDVRRGLAADDWDHVGGLRAPGRGAVAKGSEGVVPRPDDRAGGAQIGGLVGSPAGLAPS